MVSKDQKRQMMKLRGEGKTYSEIAKAVGVSQFCVGYWLTHSTRARRRKPAITHDRPKGDKVAYAVRKILDLQVPDTAKLLMIDLIV